jgi:hypothetical protein
MAYSSKVEKPRNQICASFSLPNKYLKRKAEDTIGFARCLNFGRRLIILNIRTPPGNNCDRRSFCSSFDVKAEQGFVKGVIAVVATSTLYQGSWIAISGAHHDGGCWRQRGRPNSRAEILKCETDQEFPEIRFWGLRKDLKGRTRAVSHARPGVPFSRAKQGP